MANKKDQDRLIPQRTLSTDELKKLVAESGIPVQQIENGIGMPKTTLHKVLSGSLVNGNPRLLPIKYEAPLIQFIKEKKAAKEDLKIETKEVFQELSIPLVEEEVDVPDKERKLNWIAKLQEVKSELPTG